MVFLLNVWSYETSHEVKQYICPKEYLINYVYVSFLIRYKIDKSTKYMTCFRVSDITTVQATSFMQVCNVYINFVIFTANSELQHIYKPN